ncbi:hypothetical protein HPB47_023368 [Ixodes persulcatus]|uniref:Uncharacterized protein n=1 Tax=Ixodes persulcatus TaxID=34615 RepID=A0AC60Q7J6_IXOPE|nr:hypothetical protein HPB47_023368 [Ixodes persulcatus]
MWATFFRRSRDVARNPGPNDENSQQQGRPRRRRPDATDGTLETGIIVPARLLFTPTPQDSTPMDDDARDSRSSSTTGRRHRSSGDPLGDAPHSHLQASWASRDPDDADTGGLWETAVSRAQRRATKKAANESPPTTSNRQRAELGTYVLRIQPTERCDMTAIDPEDLRRAISSLAADAALLRHQLLRVSKLSNSITVTTCDPTQAGRVLKMVTLPLRSRRPLPVRVYQVPNEGMSRGIIHRCKPNEPTEKLLEALYADGVEILTARPMGSRGTVLICFASPHPPKEVTYWDFPRRVERYEQRSLVCVRCHQPGHKANVCPAERPLCSTCGHQHDQAPEDCPNEESKYCVRCRRDGHVATDSACPAREKFSQKAKERKTNAREHRSRSRSRRRSHNGSRRQPSSTHAPGEPSSQPSDGTDSNPTHNMQEHRSTNGTDYTQEHRSTSRVRIVEPNPTYADMAGRSARTHEHKELSRLQREHDEEQKIYEEDMRHLQHQMDNLQRAIEETKKKHTQRRRSREDHLRTLRAQLDETPRLEQEFVVESKRRQSPSPRKYRESMHTEGYHEQTARHQHTDGGATWLILMTFVVGVMDATDDCHQ